MKRMGLLVVVVMALAAQTGPTIGLRIPVWDWSQPGANKYVYLTMDELAARLPQVLPGVTLVPTGEIIASPIEGRPLAVGLFVNRQFVVTHAADEHLTAPGGTCEQSAVEVLNATGLYKCWDTQDPVRGKRWVRIGVQQ